MSQLNDSLQIDSDFTIDTLYDLLENEVGYTVLGDESGYRYAEFPEKEQAEDYIVFLKYKSEN